MSEEAAPQASFLDRLSAGTLVFDGAMGTMLYARGVFLNRCFDELNLSSPGLVRQIHDEYVEAGAEVLETNTFGAHRFKLGPHGHRRRHPVRGGTLGQERSDTCGGWKWWRPAATSKRERSRSGRSPSRSGSPSRTDGRDSPCDPFARRGRPVPSLRWFTSDAAYEPGMAPLFAPWRKTSLTEPVLAPAAAGLSLRTAGSGFSHFDVETSGVDLDFQVGFTTDQAGDLRLGLALTRIYGADYEGFQGLSASPLQWSLAAPFPWSAHVVMPLPASHVGEIMKQMSWEHELMGAIAPSVAAPREMPDQVLFAARLARGLTLLTQGTAFDVTTRAYDQSVGLAEPHAQRISLGRPSDHQPRRYVET